MKTNEEIGKLAEKAYDEDAKHNPEPQNPYAFRYGYILGFKEGQKTCTEKQEWLFATIKSPKQFQECIFVVESRDETYNGRVMGGIYQGVVFGYHEFTTPGIAWRATLWLPSPTVPKKTKNEG